MIEYPYLSPSLSESDRENLIKAHFHEIMKALGLRTDDDSLKNTPARVAKMFVREIFSGLSEVPPKITVQENKFNYNQMLIEKDIAVRSVCEHHFVPIVGVCHIGYVPDKKLIGLSKLNRVADFYSRRPQVQERLTEQIRAFLVDSLQTESVIVTIDATHFCVVLRGVKDMNSVTRTTALGGVFLQKGARDEFLGAIGTIKKF